MLKLKMMLCVMMSLVVARLHISSPSVSEVTTASGVDNAASP